MGVMDVQASGKRQTHNFTHHPTQATSSRLHTTLKAGIINCSGTGFRLAADEDPYVPSRLRANQTAAVGSRIQDLKVAIRSYIRY